MRRLLSILAFAAACPLLVSGCSDVTEINITDEGEIAELIGELLWFNAKGVYGVEDTSGTLAGSFTPVFWWRVVNQNPPFDMDIDINSERDSAFVTLRLDVSGSLRIIGLDSIMNIDTLDKALNDNAVRYAVFLKDTVETYHSGWRLDKLSGVEVSSDNATVSVDSVRLGCASYPDTVYKDPLELLSLDQVLAFGASESVSLWVYVNYDTAEVYFHSWQRSNWLRWELTYRNPGEYCWAWTAPSDAGIYHAAFDVIHKNTMWDDQYFYDSRVWILPYVVR